MSNDQDSIEVEGTVNAVLSHGNYKVTFPNNHEVMTRICGKMRKFNIRITAGDNVTVRLSRYDLSNGLITYRHRYPIKINADEVLGKSKT